MTDALKYIIAATVLLSAAFPAQAGWYKVTNYEGKIGRYPVHVSVQDLDDGYYDEHHPRGELVGSYYYDSKRIPIEIHGTRQLDGTIKLCEGALSDLTRSQPKNDKRELAPCPFELTSTNEGLTGAWRSGTASYVVDLRTVGTFDNTTGKGTLSGALDIPMWLHGKNHMYLGAYQWLSGEIILRWLKAVNVQTGRIDAIADLACAPGDEGCQPGLLYTDIYSNIQSVIAEDKVVVGYGNGKMGEDKSIVLNLHTFCDSSETIIFSCQAGKEIISACASKDLSPKMGYLQIRRGAQGQPPSFVLPRDKVHPSNFFEFSPLPQHNDGAGATTYYELTFSDSALDYTLSYDEGLDGLKDPSGSFTQMGRGTGPSSTVNMECKSASIVESFGDLLDVFYNKIK